MLKELISKVVERDDLKEDEMIQAMNEIMSGEATPSQIAAFITALRMKGETVDEITGAAKVMRSRAERVHIDREKAKYGVILDVVGTGGDRSGTFNVSTATAFVSAGAGITVAKHGNRSVSSKCGVADVLEKLGVNLNIPPRDVESCINTTGIGFLFAPVFHTAMKHAAVPRRETGIRSIFNLLGPLTNPADATVLLLGVYDINLTEKIAKVLGRLGASDAFVVCGEGNIDEISICSPTRVSQLKRGEVTTFEITPEDFGLNRAGIKEISGGDSAENAEIIKRLLGGERGPRRDIVLINTSAALLAAGHVKSFREGVKTAEEVINSGRAMKKMNDLIEFTKNAGREK